ncbi:MAG: hypothetical protein QM607_03965 [Microbacterium sp.]
MSELDRLVRMAGRAPSAHNTQPWRVAVDGDVVRLDADPERMLPASDPDGRDLRLALGAWIEVFAIGAHAEGREVDVRRVGDVFELRLLDGAPHDEFTPDEVRARGVYRGRLAPQLGVFDDAELPPGLRLLAVDDRVFTPLARVSGADTFAHRDLAAELLHWLRLTPADPRWDRDGLTAETLLIAPPLARAAAILLSRARPAVLAPVALGARIAGRGSLKPRRRVKPDAPTHHVLIAKHPSTGSGTDGVAAGRALLRLWLHAQRRGVRVAPHSEVIDCPRTHAALRDALCLPDDARALAVFSAGRPLGDVPRSARVTDAPVG